MVRNICLLFLLLQVVVYGGPARNSARALNLSVVGIEGLGGVDVEFISGLLVSEVRQGQAGVYRVVSRDRRIYAEQAARLTTEDLKGVGELLGADVILTGTVGSVDVGSWFYDLRVLDVMTGEVLYSRNTEIIGKYTDFVSGVRYAIQSLFGGGSVGRVGVVRVPTRSVLVQGRVDTVRQEVHIFNHPVSNGLKPGSSGGGPVWMPCSFCQGRGSYMDGKMKRRCPMYCMQGGPSVGIGVYLYGKWVR